MPSDEYLPGRFVNAQSTVGTFQFQGQGCVSSNEAHFDTQRNLDFIAVFKPVRLIPYLLAVYVGAVFTSQVPQQVSSIVPLYARMVTRNLAFGQNHIAIRAAADQYIVPVYNPPLSLKFPLIDDQHGHILTYHTPPPARAGPALQASRLVCPNFVDNCSQLSYKCPVLTESALSRMMICQTPHPGEEESMARLLEPGTVLRRRYKIIAPVGQGGMGAVYRAEDLRLEGRICAVKEIRPDPDASPEELEQAQEQFHREASILARLDHPNLPKVSDIFTERQREYLVMDFVEGPDLRQLMEQKRLQGEFLDERVVLQWVEQLCDALEYLHSQNPPVLHRDIKPANIKLTPGGLIKLVDFGLVKLLAADDSSTITVLQGRGTLAYTPLEQYGGDTGHTDVRSDIYSLGATIYHLLTNQPPADARQRFLNPDALIFPRAINPNISPATERAILAAIAMHPEPRPPSVAAFRELLHAGDSFYPPHLLTPRQEEWYRAVVDNLGLILLAGLMLLLAVLATFL